MNKESDDRIGRFLPGFVRTSVPADGQVHEVEGLQMAVHRVRRASGRVGVAPRASGGEIEIARFMSQIIRVVMTMSEDGLPVGRSTKSSGMKQLCFGGGEVLVTNERVLAVVAIGESLLGDLDETSGSVLMVEFPHSRVESVELARKRKVFGGVKDKHVRIAATTTPAVLDLEPVYALDSNSVSPRKVDYAVCADAVVRSACAARLSRDGLAASERSRLERVSEGARDVDGDDTIAWLTDPNS